MRNRKEIKYIRLATVMMLVLGIVLVAVSAFYVSSFLAIIGLALAFWAAILFYVMPVKHVPLNLFNASADSTAGNIERVLVELNLLEKGIYLPPANLQNIESSLVFVPFVHKAALPTIEELSDKLYSKRKNGIILTPPGLELCKLFEQELGISFTKTTLTYLQATLPKLLIENLELAQTLEVKIVGGLIIVDVTGTLFTDLCQQTNNQPRTHNQIGCLLSSAIACALAKSSGQPITILNEAQYPKDQAIHIEYNIETPVIVSNKDGVPIIYGKEPEVKIILPHEIPVITLSEESATAKTAPKDYEIPVIVIREDLTKKKPKTATQEPHVSIVQPTEVPVIIIAQENLKKEESTLQNQVSIIIVPDIIESPALIANVPEPTQKEETKLTPLYALPLHTPSMAALPSPAITIPGLPVLSSPMPILPVLVTAPNEPAIPEITPKASEVPAEAEAKPTVIMPNADEVPEAIPKAHEPPAVISEVAKIPVPAEKKIVVMPDGFEIPDTNEKVSKVPEVSQTIIEESVLPPAITSKESPRPQAEFEFPEAIQKKPKPVPDTIYGVNPKHHHSSIVIQKEVQLPQKEPDAQKQKTGENNNTQNEAKE